MPELQNPVIVLPGITASTLVDQYPLDAQTLWSAVLNKEYERLSMHPDDPRYEAVEPALVRAERAFSMIYTDLVRALRYELTARADRPTPVFLFPYDWRQDLRRSATDLHDFVQEAIARTALLRHYKGFAERDPRVDLVCHSMGGLLACEYLANFKARARVRRVATLGTPFLGSLEALVKLLTGMGNLSGAVPHEREREAARSMTSIYQLLPSYGGALLPVGDPPPPADLFRLEAWQYGVLESLSEYIRLHAVDPGGATTRWTRAEALLGEFLAAARAHRRQVERLDLAAAGLGAQDWLAIVGIGAQTRVHVNVRFEGGRRRGRRWPRYVMDEKPVSAWPENPRSHDTGDNTVPLPAALPPFLPVETLVAVSPAEFGFWELRDRLLDAVSGFHAMLPNMNLCQRLVLKHLRPEFRGQVKGRPVPGVAAGDWAPPIALERID